IQRITTQNPRVVGILRGKKEYSADKIAELLTEIKLFYTVLDITLKDSVEIPSSKKFLPKEIQETLRGEGIDVLLVIQPDTAFSEREKYELDQYIMRGGRILWVLDNQKVDLKNGPTLSMFRNLNLDDFFPNYGLKLNYDLVQDISCGMIDVIQGFNNGPVWSAEKWLYYPMIYEQTDHPVCKNVDALLFRYANSIDTLPRPNIRHEVLVRSSQFSRTVQGQVYIDINELLNNPPPISTFKNSGRKILAAAVSGQFRSLFSGREVPTDKLYPHQPKSIFLEQNKIPTKLILVADGQMALGNDYRGRIEFMPFDNKTFLINCIDYLMEKEALTELRAKDLKIRTLDKEKVKENVLLIQIINVVLPVVLVIGFGLVRFYVRKKRNESYQTEKSL
ncbi:MAG: Gldg family protein, partial [Bacteroidia bacterium]|nr:Gldg family protein [Bacteroidia bacterium]